MGKLACVFILGLMAFVTIEANNPLKKSIEKSNQLLPSVSFVPAARKLLQDDDDLYYEDDGTDDMTYDDSDDAYNGGDGGERGIGSGGGNNGNNGGGGGNNGNNGNNGGKPMFGCLNIQFVSVCA